MADRLAEHRSVRVPTWGQHRHLGSWTRRSIGRLYRQVARCRSDLHRRSRSGAARPSGLYQRGPPSTLSPQDVVETLLAAEPQRDHTAGRLRRARSSKRSPANLTVNSNIVMRQMIAVSQLDGGIEISGVYIMPPQGLSNPRIAEVSRDFEFDAQTYFTNRLVTPGGLLDARAAGPTLVNLIAPAGSLIPRPCYQGARSRSTRSPSFTPGGRRPRSISTSHGDQVGRDRSAYRTDRRQSLLASRSRACGLVCFSMRRRSGIFEPVVQS